MGKDKDRKQDKEKKHKHKDKDKHKKRRRRRSSSPDSGSDSDEHRKRQKAEKMVGSWRVSDTNRHLCHVSLRDWCMETERYSRREALVVVLAPHSMALGGTPAHGGACFHEATCTHCLQQWHSRDSNSGHLGCNLSHCA